MHRMGYILKLYNENVELAHYYILELYFPLIFSP